MTAANFYLLDGEHLADLHEAATPVEQEVSVKKFFFTRRKLVRVDSLCRFVSEHARKLGAFTGSAGAFAALDRMLCGRGFPTMFSSRRLACDDAAVAFFDRTLAEGTLAALQKLRPTPDDVAAFLSSFSGVADAAGVDAILAAFRQLQMWLTGIPPETVGILSIAEPGCGFTEDCELPECAERTRGGDGAG